MGRGHPLNYCIAGALALASGRPALAAEEASPACTPGRPCVTLKPAELFDLAERLAAAKRISDAEAVLHSLTANRDADVRAEARFRLGNLRRNTGDLAGAAAAYRQLLDEKPDAAPVRLELARVLAQMGHEDAALGQLRRASSGGLPEDVVQVVDKFRLALRSRRRSGGSIELGLAPDTNINRATSLSTVLIGSNPISLSSEAQAHSGVGATIGSQVFWRPAINPDTNLLFTASASATLYRQSAFNDISLSVAAGPELLRGRSRYRPAAVYVRRWFGNQRYGDSRGATLNWLRQLGRVSQVQVDLTALRSDFRLNPAMDGGSFGTAIRYERALSPRLFARFTVRIDRQTARDPAFATWSAGAEALVTRDIGRVSAYLRAGYSRTRADAPFALPPARRDDRLVDLEAGLVLRSHTLFGFAPLIEVQHTENHSPVFFYDFRRTRMSFGVTRAF